MATYKGVEIDTSPTEGMVEEAKKGLDWREEYGRGGTEVGVARARDAFIPPQPFASWTLNEDTCLWEAPVAMPDDGKLYQWNEEAGAWEEVPLAEAS